MPLDRLIRSIRDLRSEHLVLLKKIRSDTERVARHKYGIEAGQLRLFVHYQPTYCASSLPSTGTDTPFRPLSRPCRTPLALPA